MGNVPADTQEVFLGPGELYFGSRNTRIRTLLGSCVAITMWHPKRRIGGMCHYMLPGAAVASSPRVRGRYAEDALAAMTDFARRCHTRLPDYEYKLFGGGNMFPDIRVAAKQPIGESNVACGRLLLSRLGVFVTAEHSGGIGQRAVVLDLWSGDAWVRHDALQPPMPERVAQRERLTC